CSANQDYVLRIGSGKVGVRRYVPEKQHAKAPNFGVWGLAMSAFTEHRDELEHYEQMFGKERGRLAVSLDRLTNALVLVGQHGVYCSNQRNPTVPAMDIRMVTQELTHAKELVQSVMEELRRARGDAAAEL